MTAQSFEYWKNREIKDNKRDWEAKGENWIQDYWKSTSHPHRKLITDKMRELSPRSVLEVGCNCGPNLYLIKALFSNVSVIGIDANEKAIEIAREKLSGEFIVGDFTKGLPFEDKSIDVILSDAVMLYVDKNKIARVVNELVRVAKKAIIFVEWYDISEYGKLVNFHWARDYTTLLNHKGWYVVHHKLTHEEWPNTSWEKYGVMFTAIPRTPTD